MSLRVQVDGRTAIQHFLARTLAQAPFGIDSRLRHIVGGSRGGGFEWHCAPQFQAVNGVTALMLDSDAQILRATTVYDSRQLEGQQRSALIAESTSS